MTIFKPWKMLFLLLINVLLVACATQGVNTVEPIPRASMAQVQVSYDSGNYQQALEDLSILAIEGDAEAQYALGYMYYHGQGTEQNIDLAKGWFQEALDGGLSKAQQALEAAEALGDTNN